VTLALTLFVSAPALAASSHKGKVVEAGDGKLTMTDMAGKNQHTYEIDANTTILCGRKKCGLEDLKAGSVITVTLEKKGDKPQVTRVRMRQAAKKVSS
jgi:hypothetical protein